MRKTALFIFVLFLIPFAGFGQAAGSVAGQQVITFKFLPGQDMFYIPYGGNDAELDRLYSLVDEYRTEITAGRIPIHVDGYCASGENTETSFKIAATRSNRVKSELITNKGLIESNFVTKNHTSAYEGHKDMVVVTLRIPAKEQPRQPKPVREEPKREEPPVVEQKPEQVVEAQPEPRHEPQPTVEPADPWKHPYCLAVRTNLLYDAFLLPTLGIEWRINRNVGIKLDGSLAWWGGNTGKVQKMWFVSPEVRWYLTQKKQLYVGVGGNYGEYNTYGYLLGKLYSDNTGYQGTLWGAGLTVGYQLPLSRSFALDFNLGLGYTSFEYDSFNITNETRVYKDKNKSKDFWGPTQAGISLIWTIGGNK
jgi:Periplasmic protein TonB, links inner and outer membranes